MRLVLANNTIQLNLFEDPACPGWLEYNFAEPWMAERAFEQTPEDAPAWEARRYFSLCIHLEYVPDWEDFQACRVQHVPDGDHDYILGELFDGDWTAVLFPDCPESVRPYLDAEKVYRDFFHLDGDNLEFPDAADYSHPGYVMAHRPDM